MCGIVGYLGKKFPVPLIIQSLRNLEYRGYDSAGIAYFGDDHDLQVYKTSGKLINLENVLPAGAMENRAGNGNVNIGIGHIRWATHGLPNEINAHPHVGGDKTVAIVHNGIIENFFDLRRELEAKGHKFVSETDTECIAHLLDSIAKEDDNFSSVIQKALKQLKGAYALGVISKKDPEKLYAVRNQAPLVVGLGDNEYMVASDSVALAQHNINKVIYLNDNEIAEITPDGVNVMTVDGKQLTPKIDVLDMGPLQIDKKGFKHFMMKEIHEQPDVIRNSLAGRLISPQQPIQLLSREEDKEGSQSDEILASVNRLIVIGCGTSFNAGLVGKYFIEDLVNIPVEVESAGEFRYRNPVINEHTMVVAVSQSGETADTLAALRQAKEKGARVLAVTNREDSTIARESDIVVHVRAGVEVSVCATKSFTAQIIVLYLLGMVMAEQRKSYHPEMMETLKSDFVKLPALIESMLSNQQPIKEMAKKYGNASNMLFIARGINFPVALEGALKLKEISYIHAEGYSGSELKHGPIAMLDSNMPVVAVLSEGTVFEKMISNCQEAKARDAMVVGFTSVPVDEELQNTFNDLVEIPATNELLSPLINTVPLQLLAYYMAEYLGKDVDQPRNLAKSVTVE